MSEKSKIDQQKDGQKVEQAGSLVRKSRPAQCLSPMVETDFLNRLVSGKFRLSRVIGR
jgi:hypothetical protein